MLPPRLRVANPPEQVVKINIARIEIALLMSITPPGASKIADSTVLTPSTS